MRSNHAHSRPIQARAEIRSEGSACEELSLFPPNFRSLNPTSLSWDNGVQFAGALPLLVALQNGKSFNPDVTVLSQLIENGCVVNYSPSEVVEFKKRVAQLSQREIAERTERRYLLQLEREYSLWDKVASIPRMLSTSALSPGFEEKLGVLRRDIADAKKKHQELLASLVEAQSAKKILSKLVSCGLNNLVLAPIGELLLKGDILRQLEEPTLTIDLSVYRIQSLIAACEAVRDRYQEIGSRLLSKNECKRVLHLGDIQVGLTAVRGSVQDVVERFTDTFNRLKRDIEGNDRSLALLSLGLTRVQDDNEDNLSRLKQIAEVLFPERNWPMASFFLTQAAHCIFPGMQEDALSQRYRDLSRAISHAKWGTRHRLVGQFASILAVTIEGNSELILNQLSDLAESLEDLAGFRSEIEVEVASLLVLVAQGSIYRILQRTVEARGLLGEPPYYHHGSTLVNSVVLSMLPGSIDENAHHLEMFSEGELSTSIFRPDCLLLTAAYAELERQHPALLPARGTMEQTSPSIIQSMCGSILSADIVG